MEDKYPKAYKQVIEILKYVPQESVDKIPQEMIKTFKINMDDKYDFKIDISKSFEEQDILEETKAILANIFRDYWATPEQKERILEKERNDREIEENIKREKYNPDNLFKKKQKVIQQNEEIQSNLPVEIKKEKFYEKIINFLKKIFHINWYINWQYRLNMVLCNIFNLYFYNLLIQILIQTLIKQQILLKRKEEYCEFRSIKKHNRTN